MIGSPRLATHRPRPRRSGQRGQAILTWILLIACTAIVSVLACRVFQGALPGVTATVFDTLGGMLGAESGAGWAAACSAGGSDAPAAGGAATGAAWPTAEAPPPTAEPGDGAAQDPAAYPEPTVAQLEDHQDLMADAVDTAEAVREVVWRYEELVELGKDFQEHTDSRIQKFNPVNVVGEEIAWEMMGEYVAHGLAQVGGFVTAVELGEALGSSTGKFMHFQDRAHEFEVAAEYALMRLDRLHERRRDYRERYGDEGPWGYDAANQQVGAILENGRNGVIQGTIRR